jgi:hypothetical protein
MGMKHPDAHCVRAGKDFLRTARQHLHKSSQRLASVLDVTLMAGMGKANAADQFENGPAFLNNQSRRLNKPRKFLFAKREFGAASVQMKLRHADSRATSAGSPQPRWRPPFQFP